MDVYIIDITKHHLSLLSFSTESLLLNEDLNHHINILEVKLPWETLGN
jgi:hypothetical protein